MDKIIKKAEKNGYLPKIQYKMDPVRYFEAIVFDHDFCRAYFGTKTLDIKELGFIPITKATKTIAWKFHLLAMVLKKDRKDRIKYLRKFL